MATYDLTTFTEINDGSNKWIQTASRNATASSIWIAGTNTMVLYKDMGVDAIEDYEYYLDVNMTSGTNYVTVGAWAVTNSPVPITSMSSVPGQRIQMGYSGGSVSISLRDNTTWTQDFKAGLSVSTIYYLKVSRTGSSAVCIIYPTASDRLNDTNAIDTLSITCVTTKLRYFQAGMGAGFGSGLFQGYFENFEAPVPILNIQETMSLSEEAVFSPVSEIAEDDFGITEDFESYVISYGNLSNKINTTALVLKHINDKVNTVKRVISDVLNLFNCVNGNIEDVDNDVRTLAETSNNFNNDIRFLADWQVPGDAGFVSLGKEYIKVYIASVEQTDIIVDSINIHKVVNGAHTAGFELARTYDSTRPDMEALVEIKYNDYLLYKGYITSINPASSPEKISISCQNKYWKQNRDKSYFFVGHKPRDNQELYYSKISNALSTEFSLDFGIGNFVPQTINVFGKKESDAITSLITTCGNYGWYYDVNENKKLWTAGQGSIINLERQELGTNLGLFQVISHTMKESISNIVNKLRVQMGEKVIRRFNDTGASKEYTGYTYEYFQLQALPDWDTTYEVLAKNSGWGHGVDYPPDDAEGKELYKDVFKKFKVTLLDKELSSWTDIYPPEVHLLMPFSIFWTPSFKEGVMKDGFSFDYDTGTLTFSDKMYLSDKSPNGEDDRVRAPEVTLKLWKKRYYSNTENESDNPRTDVSNPLMFFTDKVGSYSETILDDLTLSNFSIQTGGNYLDTDGNRIIVPSWNDTAFARDYAYWQLSNSAYKEITGSIEVTLDTIVTYGINLSNRINIDGITDGALNIISLSYNMSNFTVSIQVEDNHYYKRTTSLPSHGE